MTRDVFKGFFIPYYTGSLMYMLFVCGFMYNDLVLYMNSLLFICKIFKIILNCTCVRRKR
jgi:hypothetical protein